MGANGMNRLQLLANVSKAKQAIIELRNEQALHLSKLSSEVMGKSILNTQDSWELKGRISGLEDAIQLMTGHKLYL